MKIAFPIVAFTLAGLWVSSVGGCAMPGRLTPPAELERGFVHPPDSARPWVYWYFMDGNQDRAAMTADPAR